MIDRRALLASTLALASCGAGEAPVPPPRQARAWTEEDDADLRARLAARQPTALIARETDRTMDALRGRAQVLGLTLTPRGRPWRVHPRRG